MGQKGRAPKRQWQEEVTKERRRLRWQLTNVVACGGTRSSSLESASRNRRRQPSGLWRGKLSRVGGVSLSGVSPECRWENGTTVSAQFRTSFGHTPNTTASTIGRNRGSSALGGLPMSLAFSEIHYSPISPRQPYAGTSGLASTKGRVGARSTWNWASCPVLWVKNGRYYGQRCGNWRSVRMRVRRSPRKRRTDCSAQRHKRALLF